MLLTKIKEKCICYVKGYLLSQVLCFPPISEVNGDGGSGWGGHRRAETCQKKDLRQNKPERTAR